MGNYIDRENLLKEIGKSLEDNHHRDQIESRNHIHEHKHFMYMVDRAPLEDVELVVHGKWVFDPGIPGKEDPKMRCSVCGRICLEDDAPYCYCGAKMDGGENDGGG